MNYLRRKQIQNKWCNRLSHNLQQVDDQGESQPSKYHITSNIYTMIRWNCRTFSQWTLHCCRYEPEVKIYPQSDLRRPLSIWRARAGRWRGWSPWPSCIACSRLPSSWSCSSWGTRAVVESWRARPASTYGGAGRTISINKVSRNLVSMMNYLGWSKVRLFWAEKKVEIDEDSAVTTEKLD